MAAFLENIFHKYSNVTALDFKFGKYNPLAKREK